jgi:60 kDa SS-A/Ro ribonucleoprotein
MQKLWRIANMTSPAFANAEQRRCALTQIPQEIHTGRELLRFAAMVDQVRGWGRGLRSAIGDWYLARPVTTIAREVLDPRRSRGWSHRDLIKLAHPRPDSIVRAALFRWIVNGIVPPRDQELRLVHAYEAARTATHSRDIVRLIDEEKLTRAMIPARWLRSAEVWEALVATMPYADLVRNLGRIASLGLLDEGRETAVLIVARLIDRRNAERAGMDLEQVERMLVQVTERTRAPRR